MNTGIKRRGVNELRCQWYPLQVLTYRFAKAYCQNLTPSIAWLSVYEEW
jgi:hypothetical protein